MPNSASILEVEATGLEIPVIYDLYLFNQFIANYKSVLMMQNDSVKANYPESLTINQDKFDLSQKIVNKIIQSASQFNFINLGQWILLGTLNIICLMFIVFGCMWID